MLSRLPAKHAQRASLPGLMRLAAACAIVFFSVTALQAHLLLAHLYGRHRVQRSRQAGGIIPAAAPWIQAAVGHTLRGPWQRSDGLLDLRAQVSVGRVLPLPAEMGFQVCARGLMWTWGLQQQGLGCRCQEDYCAKKLRHQ